MLTNARLHDDVERRTYLTAEGGEVERRESEARERGEIGDRSIAVIPNQLRSQKDRGLEEDPGDENSINTSQTPPMLASEIAARLCVGPV